MYCSVPTYAVVEGDEDKAHVDEDDGDDQEVKGDEDEADLDEDDAKIHLRPVPAHKHR